jgi:hypothetical protein
MFHAIIEGGISMVEIVVALYLVGFVIKAALMFGTMNIALGVHFRLCERQEIEINPLFVIVVMIFMVLVTAFFGWPGALRREGWSFFRTYTKRETMKDVLAFYDTNY